MIKVYGIPTCTTCKKALKWLDDNQAEYEFINTKDHPPDRATIQSWVARLGAKPMRNTSGQAYRALGEEKSNWSDDQWIEAFSQDAMLIKRPLFVRDETAVLVGFKDQAESIREKLGLNG
ncbi:MAG TPA: Spx/MgsR family RNA polymerase-binding regulatory protein [Allocoleopsis sp.]